MAPPNAKAGVASAEGSQEKTGNALDAIDAKRFATARARAAIIKNTLVRTGGGFILGRGTYTKHLADLADVEALLDRMGAPL